MASKSGKLSVFGFSGLEKKLRKSGTKFIKQFDIKEQRMREIVKELWRISEEIKKIQERTDIVKVVGLVVGGVGILAASFAVGLSSAVGVVSGKVVAGAHVVKTSSETDCVKAEKSLGEEFQEIVEPLKRTLEEIQETCEALKIKTNEDQSENTLLNMKEYDDIFRRVSKLKVDNGKALCEVEKMMETKNKLMMFIKSLKFIPTHAQDRQLRASIIQLAQRGQKVIDECEKMQKRLKEILKQEESSGVLVALLLLLLIGGVFYLCLQYRP